MPETGPSLLRVRWFLLDADHVVLPLFFSSSEIGKLFLHPELDGLAKREAWLLALIHQFEYGPCCFDAVDMRRVLQRVPHISRGDSGTDSDDRALLGIGFGWLVSGDDAGAGGGAE